MRFLLILKSTFCLVLFLGFNGLSTFVDYLMPKQSVDEQYSYNVTYSYVGVKEAVIFPKAISLKVNIIERLKFVLGYYVDTVHYVKNYTLETSQSNLKKK